MANFLHTSNDSMLQEMLTTDVSERNQYFERH